MGRRGEDMGDGTQLSITRWHLYGYYCSQDGKLIREFVRGLIIILIRAFFTSRKLEFPVPKRQIKHNEVL